MLARRQFLMGAAPALLLASRAADAQDKPTIRFVLDPWLFAEAALLVVATAALAGLVPARLAVRRVAPEAMRIE